MKKTLYWLADIVTAILMIFSHASSQMNLTKYAKVIRWISSVHSFLASKVISSYLTVYEPSRVIGLNLINQGNSF